MIAVDLILPNLKATSKKQAFQAIATETAALYNGSADRLLAALLDRERIGSTGIGRGAAIPHVKVDDVKRIYGVLVRLETPVDYEAIDDQPVDIIFMLLAPSDSKTTQHLKTLAYISRFLKDQKTCAALRGMSDSSLIAALLDDWAKTQAA
jgi:PTS system nitrogen regulatory IIA component